MKRMMMLFGMMLVSCAAMADTWTDPKTKITWTYTVSGDEAIVTKVNPATGDVTIPSTLGGRSVTSIGDSAFWGCSVTSVTIPEGVTSIGDSAFYYCSELTSVTIPEGVTSIGSSAFYACGGLTSVTIPEGVKSIGNSAFIGCYRLTSVTIPNSVTSIGMSAFSECSGLTSITIPNSVTNIDAFTFSECRGLTSVTIPSSVTSIGKEAFMYCSGLTSVTIPEGVTSIGDWAFHTCSGLTSVTIPSSVTSIGEDAFAYCNGLMSFAVDAGNPNYKSINGLLLSKDGKKLISGVNGNMMIPNSVTSIGDSAFSSRSGLTSVTIPNSVTNIGNRAFYSCSGLTSVTIPSSVTRIGDCVFHGCSGLTRVTMPEGVASIEYSAFEGCTGLTSVTIPSSVTSIGSRAFFSCSGMTNVVFGGNAPTCRGDVFYAVKSGCTATVKWGTTGWGSSDKWEGLTLNFIDKPKPIAFTADGYEGVYDEMGHGITVTVTDPAEGAVVTYARTEDGDYAETPILFTNVTEGAQSVYFKIMADGYFTTNGMATVTITPKPDGGPYTEAVGETEWTFMVSGGKASVTKANPATGAVTIPSTLGGRSVTSIDASAFLQCTDLTSVTIPASVTTIGNSAFWGCTNLKDVIFEGDTISSIEHEAFTDCYWDLIMHVPSTWKGRGRTICGYTVLKGSMFIVK